MQNFIRFLLRMMLRLLKVRVAFDMPPVELPQKAIYI